MDRLVGAVTLPFLSETFVIYTAIYGALWLAVSNIRRRGPIIILATVDHADKEFGSFAAGLPDTIVALLTELKKLYTDPYTAQDRARPTANVVAPPIIEFEDKADLSDVVGEKSSVKFSGVELPLRPLIALLERLAPRRRLLSSVQQTGNSLILFAAIPREGVNWRVERTLPAGASTEDTWRALSDAREELLYRIFGWMSPTGSSEWTAVKKFSEGLRAFRRTLSSDMDKKLNLREAEKQFFAARSDDKNFARCSYNLGVIYREQDNKRAAMAAFEQAIKDDPNQVQAAYALSVIHREMYDESLGRGQLALDQLSRALRFADRVIAHAPAHAQAWNIKGYIWRLMHATPSSKDAWKSSRRFHKKAAGLAWRDLCLAAWRGEDARRAAAGEIATPFINLTKVYTELGSYWRAARTLRQAIGQYQTANLHFEKGKVAYNANHYATSIREYRSALSFSPTLKDRARYYAFVAKTQTAISRSDSWWPTRRGVGAMLGPNFDVYDAALASPSSTDEETRNTLRAAYENLPDKLSTISLITKVLDSVRERKDESASTRMERLRREYDNRTSYLVGQELDRFVDWARGTLEIEIGDSIVRAEPANQYALLDAQQFLRRGISRVEKDFPREERLGFAYERLAESLRLQSKCEQALPFAKRAVDLALFSPTATRQLGLIHFGLVDFDRAEQELRKSFALAPSDAETLEFIGNILRSRGDVATNSETRRSEFREVIETFNNAVDLTEDDRDRGTLHYWLGRFHGDVGDYDMSTKHYAMAKALNVYSIECSFYSGWIALEQELFDRAESYLRESRREIFRSRPVISQPETSHFATEAVVAGIVC